jgi:hypothetical protein
MTINLHQGSATIYQFPAGGRAALGGRRYGAANSSIDTNTPRANEALCSDSWYHQEAIEESKPGFKPARDH